MFERMKIAKRHRPLVSVEPSTRSSRVNLGRALLVLAALCLSGSAIAQETCQAATGLIVAYYFDASDKLVAVEGYRGGLRSIVPGSKTPGELLGGNLDTEIDDANSGKDIDVISAGAKTAVYFSFANSDPFPKVPVYVEDLSKQGSRLIHAGIKANGGGACKCSLVWCGRYLCCPC